MIQPVALREEDARAKPILFSAPMVRAILDGRKTQTRRICKTQPETAIGSCHWSDTGWAIENPTGSCSCKPVRVRYAVGDVLWVRETWATAAFWNNYPPSDLPRGTAIWYRADNEVQAMDKWRPSIFMPRWASRITLEVTGVRVERLQEISTEDAMAEGIPQTSGKAARLGLPGSDAPGHEWDNRTSIENYAGLWNSINGKGSWESNPWVEVYEFRRVDARAYLGMG